LSYTSGSSLVVLLENGASPNTGPFDIYINSISSSGNLIANDVSKTTLSSSGYTFTAPVEVFAVWVKSDGSITNADVAILGEIPGYNTFVSMTGSYNGSLTPGLGTVDAFIDNGYGLQNAGIIHEYLNTCPSTFGTGTGSINSSFNTLVVVKSNETGSNLVKFFADGAATSNYFYHIPAYSSSGVNANDVDICVDLSAGNYQVTASNTVNLYPSASIRPILSPFNTGGSNSDVNSWFILKSNGVAVYSGSVSGTGSFFGIPGNSFIEITSSILQPFSWTLGNTTVTTNSIDLKWTYTSEYINNQVIVQTQTQNLTTATDKNLVYYSFYAVPGSEYNANAINIITII
jgi:hypothetical protein